MQHQNGASGVSQLFTALPVQLSSFNFNRIACKLILVVSTGLGAVRPLA